MVDAVVEIALSENLVDRDRFIAPQITKRDLGRLAAAILNAAVDRRQKDPTVGLLEFDPSKQSDEFVLRILRDTSVRERNPLNGMVFRRDPGSGRWRLHDLTTLRLATSKET